jgi:hypothetical protein
MNYGIRDKLIALAQETVRKQNDALIEINATTDLNDFIDKLEKHIQSGTIEIEPDAIVQAGKLPPPLAIIQNMRSFANNPDIVRAIAKSGGAALFFNESYITSEHNIRDKFISFIRQIHQKNLQEQAVARVLNNSNSVDELIQNLEEHVKNHFIIDHGQPLDTKKMLESLKTIRNDPDMLSSLKTPHLVNAVFMNSGIPQEFGIQTKLIDLVKKGQISAPVQTAVTLPSQPVEVASSSSSQTALIQNPALDLILNKNLTQIKQEHDSLKKQMKGNKGWIPHIPGNKAFTEKGKRREEQMEELSRIFTHIQNQGSVKFENKASQAYAYLLYMQHRIVAESDANHPVKDSAFFQLCEIYKKSIQNILGDKAINDIEKSNWSIAANSLQAEIKLPITGADIQGKKLIS